jgi:hypothetical protein
MYSVHSEDDLSKMVHLARKKNILARFVMKGCPFCVDSQPEWDSFKDRYSGDLALAEIESSYLQHFQKLMAPRSDPIQVNGYPSIIMIRDSKVSIVPSLQVIKKKTKKKKTKKTKKNKTRKNKRKKA